jgi:uncharacterized membrane protein
MQVTTKRTILKIFSFFLILLFTPGNIYAHGDYSELITNPFVFGASILTFVIFSVMIQLLNKSWIPPVELTHWKLGLSLLFVSGLIYFIGMRDHVIAVLFLLLLASIVPAVNVVINNELTTKQKVIVFFLSSAIYFVSGGICGFFYLSSL